MIDRARLGAALGGLQVQRPSPVRPWLEAARDEGIDALLASRWRADGESGDTDRNDCEAILQRASARELFLHHQERQALAAIHDAGIDVLVLKGTALSRWLYEAPRLRPRSDLDLLLRSRDDFDRCRDALSRLGYADRDLPVLPPSFERALRKPVGSGEHCVDVHWRLSNHPAFAESFSFDALWLNRQSLPGLPGSFGLGPVDAMIHACLHRACNLTEAAGDKLIWLYDIALLSRRFGDGDWTTLLTKAVDGRVAEPCWHSLGATRTMFGVTIPDRVMQSLGAAAEQEPFQMDRAHHLIYRSWWAFRSLSWSERLPWLFRRLFPGWAYMQAHFGLTHRRQLPWAWCKRLAKLLLSARQKR